LSILDNITVVDSDLSDVKGDIDDFKFSGQSDYSTQITTAKREVYRRLKKDYWKDNPALTSAEIDTALEDVKDIPNLETLKDNIVYTALANIMFANGILELSQVYQNKADDTQIDYWVDEDSDSVVEDAEIYKHSAISIGR
tara:strand:- start:91 stop:513 length:423 start_codon:yes stop_codon:yes gene_type:complete